MRKVIAEVLSSKPISLKNATTTLSKFVSTDNGAEPAVCAYLRRSLNSFKELRHEKELGGPRSEQRHYQPKSETLSDVSHKQKRDQPESNITGGNPIEKDEKPTRIAVSGQETCHRVGDEGKREKHRKNKQKGVFDKFGDNGGEVGESRDTEIKVKIEPVENPGRRDEGNVGMESERKKHKKKKIIPEEIKVESKELGLANSYSVEPQSNKRKKKEINDGGDFKNNGIKAGDRDDRGKMGIEEVKKESKKRKNEEVEAKAEDCSEEQRGKKKKRRKTD